MKRLRHVVKVMRPPAPGGESSQAIPPQAIRNEVPCSIETLMGREAERMQQMYAGANVKVCMYGDPNNQLKAVDYCIDQTGKRLNIMGITDPSRSQLGKIELICGEELA